MYPIVKIMSEMLNIISQFHLQGKFESSSEWCVERLLFFCWIQSEETGDTQLWYGPFRKVDHKSKDLGLISC